MGWIFCKSYISNYAAILAGFPLGVIFALGRASSYKTIKLVSVIFIETFRGAPLIAWLFFAWFVLPNFLPDLFSLSDINLIIRAMIVFYHFFQVPMLLK